MKKLFLFLFIFAVSPVFAKDRWKIHSEVSYVKTSGNSDTETLSVKTEVKKEEVINRYSFKGEFLYGKTDNKENTNKFYLLGRWERLLTKKLFGFIQGDYLRDRFSGFDYRTVWGFGLGYDFIKTKKHQLKGLVSLGYTFEDLKSGATDDYTSGKAEILYQWNIRENLKFKEDLNYLQSFKEYKIYYINSSTGLEVKINAHFSLGVGYKIAYQHSPPSTGIKKTDTTFLTSLIYDY